MSVAAEPAPREERWRPVRTPNLPNSLTLLRIVVIPILVGLFYLDGEAWRWISFVLFAAAGITDFFDGYLARARAQVSELGRFLDPIADKLLVAAVILMLVAFDRIHGLVVLPALVILCREILVSGLREYLAGLNVGMPVSRLSKWKTMLQMVALGLLLLGDVSELPGVPIVIIGEVGLWVAAAITFVTGYDYFLAGLKHMGGRPGRADSAMPAADTPARHAR
ncbi:MAG: CDP-diacylglycerol--glycerol-3-phosphate 3-phosphatidyltransferase [Rhodospirillaceae bacterium]|nr:CDP-diacylglycerol--glycerol-3-phosphate 3-phosphatidyltransferase [Rhodospirillaceae bacterium]